MKLIIAYKHGSIVELSCFVDGADEYPVKHCHGKNQLLSARPEIN